MTKAFDPKYDKWMLAFAVLFAGAMASGAFAPVAVMLLPFVFARAAVRTGYLAFALEALALTVIAYQYDYSALLVAFMTWMFFVTALAAFINKPRARSFTKRLMINLFALFLVMVGLMPWLHEYTEGDVVAGLAGRLTAAVAASPSCDQMLVQLYQYGFAGMTEKLLAAQRIADGITDLLGTKINLLAPVREELLKSLETTLFHAFNGLLPMGVSLYASVGTLFMTMIPVNALRQKGIKVEDPPPFAVWHIAPPLTGFAAMLLPGYIIPLFTSDRAWLMMGTMMTTMLLAILCVQGLSVVAHLQIKAGIKRGARTVWAVVMVLMFYQIPMLIGVLDQVLDFRRLRPKNKEDMQ